MFRMDQGINRDVLDKDPTYNPLLSGFKSDGSQSTGRKDSQALSGNLYNYKRYKIVRYN